VTITEARAEEPAAPERGGAGVMLGVTALLLVLAVVFVVIGAVVRSDASTDRDRASTIAASGAELAKQQRQIDGQRVALRTLANAVPTQVGRLEAALTDVVGAQNRFIDVVNQASSLYAGGDRSGAANALRGDGGTTIQQLTDRNQKVQQALQKAQAALEALERAQ
jgi:hypothetical protein